MLEDGFVMMSRPMTDGCYFESSGMCLNISGKHTFTRVIHTHTPLKRTFTRVYTPTHINRSTMLISSEASVHQTLSIGSCLDHPVHSSTSRSRTCLPGGQTGSATPNVSRTLRYLPLITKGTNTIDSFTQNFVFTRTELGLGTTEWTQIFTVTMNFGKTDATKRQQFRMTIEHIDTRNMQFPSVSRPTVRRQKQHRHSITFET